MKIYSEYKNYQDYVDIQTETNKIKIGVTWVMPQEIESLCEYIVREVQLNNSSTNNHVMCHGARNGIEVEYFKKNLNDNWIVEGNDISETASDYGLYQWDMQDYNKDWKRKFNIQYTNSFDHVYEPRRTIKSFLGQCAVGGSVYIQWTDNLNNKPLPSDPLSISLEELEAMSKDYAQQVNILDTGMNRRVRYKDTGEILKNLHLYYIELKR